MPICATSGRNTSRTSQPIARYNTVESRGNRKPILSLSNTPQRRQSPDGDQQTPSPRSAQRAQRERCVGACDQDINRGVVEVSAETFRVSDRQQVIKRGRSVKQCERHPEDDPADELPGVVPVHGRASQNWQPHERREQKTHRVAQTVGKLLAFGQRTLVRLLAHENYLSPKYRQSQINSRCRDPGTSLPASARRLGNAQ